jgi:signal transduction histidine kinase
MLSCQTNHKKANLASDLSEPMDSILDRASTDELPREKMLGLLDSLTNVIAKSQNDSVSRFNLVLVANQYFYINEIDKYHEVSQKLVEMSAKANDTVDLARGYHYLGDYFTDRNIPDSSYFYFTKAEKLLADSYDRENFGRVKLKKGYLIYKINDLSSSEAIGIEALKIAHEVKDLTLEYECYNFLSSVLTSERKYAEANDYNEKALKTLDEFKDDPQYFTILKSQTYNSIGTVFMSQKEYVKASEYFKKGLEMENLISIHPSFYAFIWGNLIYCREQLGEENILEDYQNCLKIRDSMGDLAGIVDSKIKLANYYLSKKDSVHALQSIKEANKTAIEIKSHEDVTESLHVLAKADTKNSTRYFQKYVDLTDENLKQEREQHDKFARIEYETDEILSEKKLIESEKDKISLQRWMILGFSVLAILILALSYMIQSQRNKNKELQHLREQQEANEEIYKLMLDQQQKFEEGKQMEKKRISQELHDGVMGRLTGIRLNLFVLTRRRDDATIDRCLDHISEIQNVEKEIRTISHDLNKNLFSDMVNFTAIVKNLFKSIENHSDIQFELNVDEKIDWSMLDSNAKLQIYRVLQESLQNIEKHANASKVEISMAKSEGNLTIEIKDNGAGFDIKIAKQGIGLKNIQDRIEQIGGKAIIDSVVGHGTIINLIFPI